MTKEERPEWWQIQEWKDKQEAERKAAQDARVRAGIRTGDAEADLSDMAAVLAFEEENPGNNGRKEARIRRVFRMSAMRYYQALNALIDDPAAIAMNPILMRRLGNLRQVRMKSRREGFLGQLRRV